MQIARANRNIQRYKQKKIQTNKDTNKQRYKQTKIQTNKDTDKQGKPKQETRAGAEYANFKTFVTVFN